MTGPRQYELPAGHHLELRRHRVDAKLLNEALEWAGCEVLTGIDWPLDTDTQHGRVAITVYAGDFTPLEVIEVLLFRLMYVYLREVPQ